MNYYRIGVLISSKLEVLWKMRATLEEARYLGPYWIIKIAVLQARFDSNPGSVS